MLLADSLSQKKKSINTLCVHRERCVIQRKYQEPCNEIEFCVCACHAPDSMWSVINRAYRDLFYYYKASWDFKNGQMQP